MAAIDHSALSAPLTKAVTLDGTSQQVKWPANTRYVSFRFLTTAGIYQLGSTGDPLTVPVNEWYGVAVMADKHTGNADTKDYQLYLDGTLGNVVDIEYSVIGGR